MDFLTSALYLLLALTSIRAVFSLLRGTKKCPKVPPGPVPLPVIENLLKLGDKPNQSLAELAKTHGPIVSLKLGRVTVVVISSPAMAKEVLQKQDLAFSNRSIPNALHAHEQYKYSVVWLLVSNRWRSLRKILNSNIFSGNSLCWNNLLCLSPIPIDEFLTNSLANPLKVLLLPTSSEFLRTFLASLYDLLVLSPQERGLASLQPPQ
ncbi:hypothetical protein HYC85_015931 [Camellia sinensis]|uniref:Uncharacterized protein n=1 Tax=Camellia sinensis TaxID=4442 RepID=A0A7J7GY48_CAMSI|nr:hypothetical protein HYC85_015931 [Camellia sinensis]